jgi:putative ABC transport system permease protein
MFKNYFKIALRNLIKNKVYTAINILGLSVGIACCILIFLFVRFELSYDTFHKHKDTIYIVREKLNERIISSAPGPLGQALQADFPEVASFVRVDAYFGLSLVKYGEKIYKERIVYADLTFFTFFTFPLEHGNPETVLQNPKSIVLSKQMAEKYFGKDNPIGKILLLKHSIITKRNEFEDYIVTGIAEPIPKNSSIQFDFLINFDKTFPYDLNNWKFIGVITFIRLSSKNQAAELMDKFPGFIKKYFDTLIKQNPKDTWTLQLYPLIDYHMGANRAGSPLTPTNNPVNLYILSGIALLILLIACFNFMNLSIASSSTRIKEIGMRKVLGAHRDQVAKQFWFESILLSFAALIVGISLAELFLPAFNVLAGKSLNFGYLVNWQTLFFLIGLTFIVGIVAGSYPAVVFSGFTAIDIFRGRLKVGGKNVFTRLLIVIQFTLSIFLIILAIIMQQQQSFLMNKDLGYDKEFVLVIEIYVFGDNTKKVSQTGSLVSSLKNELIRYDNIISVSGCNRSFYYGLSGVMGKDKDGSKVTVRFLKVDYDFLETLGIKLIEGRNFSPEFPTDATGSVIVNETFIKQYAITKPIGRNISDIISGPYWGNYPIIGVVKDFHFDPLHRPIVPAFLTTNTAMPLPFASIHIKIKGTNIQETIGIIKEQFLKLFPEQPFSYTFLEDKIAGYYKSEKRWNSIIRYASILAILIACSGLFGLTLLTVARRTKEIAIRKVNGASISSIVFLLSKQFAFLVLLSNIIAWPIAWYAMNRWLQNFAYRINIGWWMFVLAGLLALVIALLTVSYQAIKAARANPVDALRYE